MIFYIHDILKYVQAFWAKQVIHTSFLNLMNNENKKYIYESQTTHSFCIIVTSFQESIGDSTPMAIPKINIEITKKKK